MHPEEPDSGKQADTEQEEEECLWKINSLVTSINKLDFNTTYNVEDEWFINENLDLTYFSTFTSDFVTSNTSTDVSSDPWSGMDALTSLCSPIKSFLIVCERSAAHAKLSLKYQPSGRVKS